MKKALFFLIILILTIIPSAATTTYYTDNAIPDGIRPYQLSLNLSNSVGTNNATTVYCNGHCNVNFTDIYFKIGETNLPFWIEDNTTGAVWVNLTINGTVRMYYGNSSMTTSLSNGDNTFVFFDHFPGTAYNASKWQPGAASPTIAVSNSNLTLTGATASWEGFGTKQQFAEGTTLSYKVVAFQNVATTAGIHAGYSLASYGTKSTLFRHKNQDLYTHDGVASSTTAKTGIQTPAIYSITRNGTTDNKFYVNYITETTKTTNLPAGQLYGEFFVTADTAAGGITIDWVYVRNSTYPRAAWATWGAETEINYIPIVASDTIQQSYDGLWNLEPGVLAEKASFIMPDYYIGSWKINFTLYSNGNTARGQIYKNDIPYGALQSTVDNSGTIFSQTFNDITILAGDKISIYANVSAGIGYLRFTRILFDYNFTNSPPTLLYPANNATNIPISTNLQWSEWPIANPYTYYVSTDEDFINILSSGTGSETCTYQNCSSVNITLDYNTKYYWKISNSTGYTTAAYNFTTTQATVTPGRLNITARDEQTNAQITNFYAQLYNASGSFLNKSSTAGWANYSSEEVSSGEYLIRVTSIGYAARSILMDSPGNATLYLPSTNNTIDTVAFYLLDYTQKFPWQTSIFELQKNNSVMHSAYFDSDAKVAAYLIRGDSYAVTVLNGANIQNWGNYISTASGNVEIVIMNLGVNTSLRNPLVYNVTWSNTNITLKWSDTYGIMTNINYTIYKGAEKTQVHNLITSVSHGSSEYILTNTSTVYYVNVSALTTNGYRNQSFVIDYRAGQTATELESTELYTWSYGSVTIPAWVKNAFAVVALMILAGSFGAMHRGEGAIITGIMSLLFWKWTWLSATGAGVGFLGALVLFAVLYHLDTKRKGGGYF